MTSFRNWSIICLSSTIYLGLLPACVSDADPLNATGAGGSSGQTSSTGGSTSNATGGASGGNNPGSGGGGAGGGGSAQVEPMPILCPAPAQALFADFNNSPPAGTADAGADAGNAAAPALVDATFGQGGSLTGGTYRYPNMGNFTIDSEVSQGTWRVSGNISDYSGFGLYWDNCNVLDLSEYAGISFTISGNVAMGGTLTLNVGTSANDIAHDWLNTNVTGSMADPSSGRCIPMNGGQYDGTCAAPNFTFQVTSTPTTVTVLWENLTAGAPSQTVNPAEITTISWNFPAPAGAGTATPSPYAADVVIDNLSFVE